MKKQHSYCKARIKWKLAHPISDLMLSDILSLVSIDAPLTVVAKWKPIERAHAEEWASQVHLSASDNLFVRIPPKPECLAGLKDIKLSDIWPKTGSN